MNCPHNVHCRNSTGFLQQQRFSGKVNISMAGAKIKKCALSRHGETVESEWTTHRRDQYSSYKKRHLAARRLATPFSPRDFRTSSSQSTAARSRHLRARSSRRAAHAATDLIDERRGPETATQQNHKHDRIRRVFPATVLPAADCADRSARALIVCS